MSATFPLDYEDRYGRVVDESQDTRPRLVTAAEVAAGRPLVVADFDVMCDADGVWVEHWHHVVTDGNRLSSDRSVRWVEREGTVITFGCGDPHGCTSSTCDDICDGVVVVDLADSDAWRAATDVDVSDMQHGEQVTS